VRDGVRSAKTRLVQQFPRLGALGCDHRGRRADEDAVREAGAPWLERFGRLDAVVANAGVLVRRPLRRMTLETGIA